MHGDLAQLTVEQRNQYVLATCKSLGLNPLTQPFKYIVLNGKLTLYATRDCADQLRKLHGISIVLVSEKLLNGLYTVHAKAREKSGREDEDYGVVSIGQNVTGEIRANLMLKAVTKAKRRVTLSICGLGWLDETEVDDIPTDEKIPHDPQTGEILEAPTPKQITTGYDEEGETNTGELYHADIQLRAAALAGMETLQQAWKTLRPAVQRTLEHAKDHTYKPMAMEADEKRAKETAQS